MTEILLTAVIVLLCIVVVLQVVFLWLRFYGRRARAKGESVGGLAPGASAKAPSAAATSNGDEKNAGAKSGMLKGTVSAITRRFRPEPEPPEPEPPVVLEAGTNGDRSAEHPHLVAARQLPGYNPARWLLADALLRRSTLLALDSRPDALAVRYQVDGVWHNGASVGPDVGRPALDALADGVRHSRQRASDAAGASLPRTTNGSATKPRWPPSRYPAASAW